MSAFHLQARLFEGPLHAPARDESCQFATDDREHAARWATQAHVDGFTVWIYTHGRPNPLPLACDWQLVARVDPRDSRAGITAVLDASDTLPERGCPRRG